MLPRALQGLSLFPALAAKACVLGWEGGWGRQDVSSSPPPQKNMTFHFELSLLFLQNALNGQKPINILDPVDWKENIFFCTPCTTCVYSQTCVYAAIVIPHHHHQHPSDLQAIVLLSDSGICTGIRKGPRMELMEKKSAYVLR